MVPSERAQSEIVGTVLLVGVVVVTTATLGAGLLGSVQPDRDPVADVSGEVTADRISLTHAGGDAMAASALTVVVRTDAGDARIPFADGTLSGPDPERFEPGETWTKSSSFPAGERVRVYLVHAPTNVVVFEGRTVAETTYFDD